MVIYILGSSTRQRGALLASRRRLELEYLNLALTFGLSLAVYLWLAFKAGSYLDGRFGTQPLLTFLGVLIAIGFSFYTLIIQLEKLSRKEKDWQKKGNGDEP